MAGVFIRVPRAGFEPAIYTLRRYRPRPLDEQGDIYLLMTQISDYVSSAASVAITRHSPGVILASQNRLVNSWIANGAIRVFYHCLAHSAKRAYYGS